MANNPHYLELMRRARRDHLRNIRRASGEIASLYEDAAKELSAQAASMGRRTLSRRWAAEYADALKQRAAQLRAGLYDVTYQGLKRSANLPLAANGDFWESIGGQSFRDMFAVTPDDILANLINGQIYKDNMGLSDRIWRASGSFEKDIDYMVNRGIAEHKSAYELAKDLEQYVKPKARRDWDWGKVYPNLARKQVDYSAQRLARTAINHAYFLSNQKVCRQNPYIEAMHWQLSDSHDERQVIPFGPDECDEYAQHDEGLGMGNWKPEQIPLPHPQCLCIQYGVVTQSLEEIGDEIGRWIAGEPNVRLDSWNALYGRNYDLQNAGNRGIIKAEEMSGERMQRKSQAGKIEPMPKKQLQRIVKNFKAHGGIIQFDDETDQYLADKHAEAITYDEKTILIKQHPGRASVFEELIHTAQFRNGENDGSYESRLKCEIAAQEKLLRNARAYELTDAEIIQTRKALEAYQKELNDYHNHGGV